MKGWKAWSRPFVILGLNAIALFVAVGPAGEVHEHHKVTGPDGSQVSALRFVYATWFVPLAEPVNASLLFALANLAVLFVVLWLMDRKGIYLKA